eukprot:823802_1
MALTTTVCLTFLAITQTVYSATANDHNITCDQNISGHFYQLNETHYYHLNTDSAAKYDIIFTSSISDNHTISTVVTIRDPIEPVPAEYCCPVDGNCASCNGTLQRRSEFVGGLFFITVQQNDIHAALRRFLHENW